MSEREPLSYQEPLSFPADSMSERRSFYSDDCEGDEGTPSHRSHLSTMSRGIALSPRGTTHSKATRNLANNFSTSRFLCATIVHRPPSADDTLALPPHQQQQQQQRKTVGTVLSRSVILSPTALEINRRSSSRNVKILELPINKRLSVPWDDLYQSDAAPSSPSAADAEQERGNFIRRTNSDVVWGDSVVSELKLPIPKTQTRPGPILLPAVTSMRRAQSKIDSDMTRSAYSIRSASSTSHLPLSSGLLSKTIRRQPVVPALDQMALDLRAGWMGEDDIEDELQDLDLFDPKENTKINRCGEVNSIFETGQCIIANEDIDYYCGIVPAGTMGTILRISQWRLFVTWHLRNFEKYGECEVCPYEVSTELENIEAQSIVRERSRPNTYGTLLTAERYNTELTLAESTGRHIEFNLDVTEFIEPPPILRNFARSTRSSPTEKVEKDAGVFTT